MRDDSVILRAPRGGIGGASASANIYRTNRNFFGLVGPVLKLIYGVGPCQKIQINCRSKSRMLVELGDCLAQSQIQRL